MDSDVIDEKAVRSEGFKWCRDSIGGIWSKITPDDFVLERINGGLSNYLYLCYLAPGLKPLGSEPDKVMLRIYGHIAKTSKSFVIFNSVVFAILSEKDLGPKLYGIYHNGRIEEYIPTKPLQRTDLKKPPLSKLIARKLAKLHSLDMPLCKEPRWLSETIEGWIKEIQNNTHPSDPENQLYIHKLQSFKMEEEFQNVLNIISKVHSPVLFCHNDLQEGNLLHMESCANTSRELTVIDWEYCSYNYRGFDIGNHFCEWAYGYSNPKPPFFSYNPEDYPNREQQFIFFKEYLENSGKENVTEKDLEALYLEVNTYALASHFFWAVWSIVQAQTSVIEFGYWEYAISRFERYIELKEKILHNKQFL
ncbi:hypothetical protein LOTGIDRAFT_116872 [Lottia gigantea]|uniref:Choline kinase N-terminal domain-containing protein n=1 Tax=Lottia gigantea TaxID=225164 RepID=V4AP75_LOTGI|nr:hypothetical protein LOTGIDRAFT_116872 [Lottia gigantea]ESO95426.1 hypothetical protein LOTGIDRAFT_116872 [Lottia gigantea]